MRFRQFSSTLLFLWLVLIGLVHSLPTTNASARLDSHDLWRRQCVKNPATGRYEKAFCDHKLPTLDQIVARTRDTSDQGKASPDHSVVFYSNLATKPKPSPQEIHAFTEWTLAWIKLRQSSGQKFYWWYEHMDIEWRLAQMRHIVEEQMSFLETWGPNALKTFDYCSHQALAAAAIHPIAYVMLPRGPTPQTVTWDQGSSWENAEFWQLTKNPNIQKIIRVDPRPPESIGMTPQDWCAIRHGEDQVLWERGVHAELEPRWQCPVYYDADGNPQ